MSEEHEHVWDYLMIVLISAMLAFVIAVGAICSWTLNRSEGGFDAKVCQVAVCKTPETK